MSQISTILIGCVGLLGLFFRIADRVNAIKHEEEDREQKGSHSVIYRLKVRT
jgi:hypothetical protein